MTFTKHYYWACETCGASPISARSQAYFTTEQEALAAGKPDQCSNVYCHSRQDSPYYDPDLAAKIKVHFLDTGGLIICGRRR